MIKKTSINRMSPMEAGNYEWLETNGRGGFCSGTAGDCPTRKYHGLLVTPISGYEGRYHIISAIEASLKVDPDFTLSSNFYPGIVFPDSQKNIKDFSSLPLACWNYTKGGITIKKELFMNRGEKAVYVVFTQNSMVDSLDIDLKFLFTCRPANSETHANNNLNTEMAIIKKGFRISPYNGLPDVCLEFSGKWMHKDSWFWDYSVEYPKEKERGLAFTEDRFVPGIISIKAKKNEPFVIRISIEEAEKRESLVNIYRQRLQEEKLKTAELRNNRDILRHFADKFLLKNSLGQKSINAGFPWFGEWGRDTMIALPGLSFCNNKTAWGVDVLQDYASLIKDGLLPNTLGESQGFTSYNSLDAGLLYCRAVLKLLESGFGINKDELAIIKKSLLPAVKSIISAFLDERVPHAELTEEKLIKAGSCDTQLTWMDATAYGKPVTPRHGLAVDINALWFDSLCVLEKLYELADEKIPAMIKNTKKAVLKNFKKTFWIEDLGYLSDTVVDNCQDRRLRPNMLFAAAAQKGLLTKKERARVVRAVKKSLLTPLGIRTLSPDDYCFAPVYRGNSDERDSQYHQGTVWPWLLGIMVESSLLSAEKLEREIEFWQSYIDNLLEKHLFSNGMGYISEIFDGLRPLNGERVLCASLEYRRNY